MSAGLRQNDETYLQLIILFQRVSNTCSVIRKEVKTPINSEKGFKNYLVLTTDQTTRLKGEK